MSDLVLDSLRRRMRAIFSLYEDAVSTMELRHINYKERDARISVMVFCIEVKNRKHLAEIIRRTRRLNVVYSVERL